MSLLNRRHFARGGVLGLIGAPFLSTRADEPGRDADRRKSPRPPTPEELARELAALRARYESLSQDLNDHSIFDPPVGAVVAYAGAWPPVNPANGQPRTEVEIGWTLCDGTPLDELARAWKLDLAELRAVLPSPNLPDYRGIFHRGLDRDRHQQSSGRDPDRAPSHVVGTPQGWATAVPNPDEAGGARRIFTDDNGQHDHNLTGNGLCVLHAPTTEAEGDVTPGNFDKSNGEIDIRNARGIPNDGSHHHYLSRGGDKETRPINVSVNYIIKFRSTPSRRTDR